MNIFVTSCKIIICDSTKASNTLSSPLWFKFLFLQTCRKKCLGFMNAIIVSKFWVENAFHLLSLSTVNLSFVWYVWHLSWQNVQILPFCQGNILQALDKEHNNCSATPEDSCKLSYAASFPVLHFSCYRSVNEPQLLWWHLFI